VVLERRLARIKEALSGARAGALVARLTPVASHQSRQGRRRHAKNALPLEEGIHKATTTKPLTKREIHDAVPMLGYRFNTLNPVNSINAKLCSRSLLKNQKGRFSPVG
jgi:hypothetical protein